jgi:plastocyanin
MAPARLTLATVLAAGLILVAVLGGSASGRSSKKVEVGDDFFNPTSLSISKGTKVKFNWTGSDEHDVVKKKGPGPGFSSGATDADGVNFTHKFKKTGTYKIICTIHEDMKMKITVH